jgi:acyl carrier protein
MTRKELAGIVHELLEKETGESYPDLEESTTLKGGLNLDSLDMAGLMLHIESRFGISVETELLENITTVGHMLDLLETKIATKGARNAA